MPPMRYFIDAAINTDDIVVPLNVYHDHGYAKLSSQSCLLSSTDHGSLVNVDDTLIGGQKENTEESDAE